MTWKKTPKPKLEPSYPPFGSAASRWPRQWPRHRAAAPPQREQSRGWAGLRGSSPRSTRPRLPAAAGTGGAPPGTAALRGVQVDEERRGALKTLKAFERWEKNGNRCTKTERRSGVKERMSLGRSGENKDGGEGNVV